MIQKSDRMGEIGEKFKGKVGEKAVAAPNDASDRIGIAVLIHSERRGKPDGIEKQLAFQDIGLQRCFQLR